MGLNLEDGCQGGLWALQTRGERCPKPSRRMVSLGTELAVPPNSPSYSIMSKFPPDLEGNATDPRASSLAGLDILPVAYPPVITEAI